MSALLWLLALTLGPLLAIGGYLLTAVPRHMREILALLNERGELDMFEVDRATGDRVTFVAAIMQLRSDGLIAKRRERTRLLYSLTSRGAFELARKP